MLPLTKAFNPADLGALQSELLLVDAHACLGQHPIRRWEYALSLRAFLTWQATGFTGFPLKTLDVGGASSDLHLMLGHLHGGAIDCLRVDPHINQTVEDYAAGPDVLPSSIDAIFSISTIEHVAWPPLFLKAIHRLLAPGGLLFLTMDGWDCEGEDTAHFHWMRKRIYNKDSWQALYRDCRTLGFRRLGTTDWTYHGPGVYDYSVFSLALVKGAAS